MSNFLIFVGAMTVAIGWFAIGVALSTLVMAEAISGVEVFLRRLWRGKRVPENINLGMLIGVAMAMIVAGATLLFFPLTRERLRDLFRYYAQKRAW